MRTCSASSEEQHEILRPSVNKLQEELTIPKATIRIKKSKRLDEETSSIHDILNTFGPTDKMNIIATPPEVNDYLDGNVQT